MGGGSKKCYLVLGVYAFFLTISTLIGYSSVNGANLGWGRIFAVFLPLYIAIALIVFVAYRILEKRVEEARPFGFYRCSMRKYWLAPFLMLCAVWLTTWLMFWPGSFTSDTTDCIAQALGIKQLSSHHSVVFTFFMLPVVRLGNALGNLELGLAALSFFTVLFLAGVCSYASFWVMQRTRSKLAFLATIAFFALNPVVAQYSISVWKDTYFAGFLLLFCLKLFDLIMVERLEGKTQLKEFLVLGAICLACVLLRNNGLIICLLTMSIACIVLKKARKRLIVLCAVVFLRILL